MSQYFQSVQITPDTVPAGDSVEFVIRLVMGRDCPTEPCRIVFDFPATLGMSRPSLTHQEDDGFVEAYVSNPAVTWTKTLWDMERQAPFSMAAQGFRGMACRLFLLDLSAGLATGDVIEIHWGDVGGGFGAGAKVTTVVPRPDYRADVHVRLFLDPDAAVPDYGRDMLDSPRPVPDAVERVQLAVTPREPVRLRLVRRTNDAVLVALDRFWNATPTDGLVDTDQPGQTNPSGGLTFDSPAVHVASKTLPLLEGPDMRDVHEGFNLYWGDIHTHSAHSNDCIEREKLQMSPADLMGYARHKAALDFYCVTDHHQPWDVPRNRIGEERWLDTLAAREAHDEPGRFLAFSGIEFRDPRGDTAVVFREPPAYDVIERPDLATVEDVWRELAGVEMLTIPHFHNGGRLAEGTWQRGPEDVEPVFEIFSCHGSFERETACENPAPLSKHRRSDRSYLWMLQQGYRYGVVCNSDGHKGHVGTNGVTAVFAKELTGEAIFQAYRARRVYGTTNARIRLLFTANGELMGSVLPNAGRKEFHIDVAGENALKRVELFGPSGVVACFTPTGKTFTADPVVACDEPGWYYVRATQHDNHIAWSSPVWFE